MRNGAVKKIALGLSMLGVVVGAGAAVDSRYAKAADVGRALSDIHQGLEDLQLGQLQTARALLARELFDYELRNHRLTPLERQRAHVVRDELDALGKRIDAMTRKQDAR